jgi:hypothetical protein
MKGEGRDGERHVHFPESWGVTRIAVGEYLSVIPSV